MKSFQESFGPKAEPENGTSDLKNVDCLTQKTQEPEKEIQSYFEDDEDDLYDDVEVN